VPELPDLTVLAEAFHAALAGRPLAEVRTPGPLTLRATPARAAELSGQLVHSVRRRGKFLLLELESDRVAINPMLTGRLQLAGHAASLPARTSVVLEFGPRVGSVPDATAWTRGAAWLPRDESTPELRYRDPTRMGKIYVSRAEGAEHVPGLGPPDQGPDADDPDLTLEAWRERIRRHPGELKALLRNQAFVAGIGNAYSDEILHAARLLPFRRRATLAESEVDELYRSTRETLARACATLRERVPPTFEVQVRDFLAVHLRGGQACPRCGTRISEVRSHGEVTSYCRGCQR
jgi:formamidopyrimidine-DNA glycosylase